MEEMAKHLKSVQQRLDQTNRLARQVVQEMQGGALVGDAGEAFANALNQSFMPAVTKLGQKFGEVSDDIKKAISDMKSADSSSAREF
jgi:WXG100 family type VII secretion target